jgi:exodeoxyribonuclease-3
MRWSLAVFRLPPKSDKKENSMKVMSYNTLFGGWDGDDDRRFKLQREVIAETHPDILLLQECKHFDFNGNRRLYQVEEALGMRGFLAVTPRTGQNTAVLVRSGIKPVAFQSDADHFHHVAAIVTLEVPSFDQPITFVSVHLCPNGPHVRLVEAAYLVNYADPNRWTLVAGDFNSVSPLDPEPSDWDSLPKHHRARYLSADGKASDRSVLQSLYSAGYVDIAGRLKRNLDSTVPGAAFKNTEFVPFRSDYFLASDVLAEKAVSYAVIKNDKTAAASDHYPIVAEFQP